MKKLLIKMGYMTSRGKIVFDEIKFDVIFLSILAGMIFIMYKFTH